MRIVVTFLFNAGLNFAVGLVVASLLGPADYGRYAVWASAGALIATGLFDWLRLSTARFYGETQRRATPALRPTLDAVYRGLAAALVVVAVLALGLPQRFGLTLTLVGAVVLTALSNAAFDYRAALARAQFQDGAYAVLVIGKGMLGLVCAGGAALLTHEPAVVLAAQACGTMLATLPVRRGLAEPGRVAATMALVRRFASYGLPVVAANVVFQSVLLLNRSTAAARFGFAAAGHLSLATDLELRILLAVGAALDILLFQLAVRSEAIGGREAASAQVRSNVTVVAAVLLLVFVGFAVTLPAFSALVVPARFQDGFVPLAHAVLPGIAAFCFGQFAINPVFQMAHRTAPIIGGALVSAVADGLGLVFLPAASGPLGIALVHSASLGLGVLCLGTLAFRDGAVRPPGRDLAGLATATLITAAALLPLRLVPSPFWSLATSVLVGPLTFCAVLMLFDVAGLRHVAGLLHGLVGRATGRAEMA